jgi:hypothetical protein
MLRRLDLRALLRIVAGDQSSSALLRQARKHSCAIQVEGSLFVGARAHHSIEVCGGTAIAGHAERGLTHSTPTLVALTGGQCAPKQLATL